jgi:hypothetical protein
VGSWTAYWAEDFWQPLTKLTQQFLKSRDLRCQSPAAAKWQRPVSAALDPMPAA